MALSDKRAQEFTSLANLRMERKTIVQCATALNKSPATVKRWLKDPEYLKFFEDLQSHWRESIQSTALDLGLRALYVMRDLMEHSRRDHVRYEAALAIGNWAGLGKSQVEVVVDDRETLRRLDALFAARQGAVPQIAPPAVAGEFREITSPEEIAVPRGP